MTLTAERPAGPLNEEPDRRGRTSGPRVSWASAQPFVRRTTPTNRPDRLHAENPWAEASTRYVLTSVGFDTLIATSVAVATLISVLGRGTVPLVAGAATGLGFALMVALMRGYDPKALGDGPAEYQAVLRGGALLAGALMAIAYTSQLAVPRRLVFVAVPVTVVLIGLGRYVQRRLLHRRRRRGEAMLRALVVGQGDQVVRIVEEFGRKPYHGYQVVGACVPSLDGSAFRVDECTPVLGAVADVPQVVVDHAVDTVIVAGSALSGEALRRLSWALGHADAELVVAPDLVDVMAPRLSLQPTRTLSLLRVEVGAPRRRMLAKAALDRTLGAILLVLASPIIAAGALAVRLDSPGPSFFRQVRVGEDGESFRLWKLRSMRTDAPDVREQLLALSDRDGPMFKMHDDPRITRVGGFLRRFSIDELPQLINVVRGEMSLVGPRPPLLSEVEAYHDAVHRRLQVRPGLTGLWQISGRADLSWEESVRLDLRYVDNWSVAMDLTILWKTARAVISGQGAY